jgi:hypothetical protein
MATDDIIEDASALDLEIAGAVGNFAVSPKEGESSIPVRYIQTHVRFSLDDTHQQRLFENLVPVREIFGPRDLGFDELMQRDIDDGRVSSSLIPYLISVSRGDQVKFFPPIVAVVVPVGPEKQLLKEYPLTIEADSVDDKQRTFRRTTSGPKGEEAFQFELLMRGDKAREFDNARLRLNTMKTKLVIVDGQHRAMALLALYRNVKGWPDKTAAFRNYYSRWSKELLRDNLREISLPIVVCVFPTLDGNHAHRASVVTACRSIFLALNKNARPVSDARNILLDDYDMISHFERKILSRIKDIAPDSSHALRLWNFELDSDENKVQVSTTVAFSGVMPLYSMLERVLLPQEQVTGLSAPARKYGNVKNLDGCLHRLDGANLLGAEVSKGINRRAFSNDAAAKLTESFDQRYGSYIISMFAGFAPFVAMSKAALKLQVRLQARGEHQVHAMLFEGQGILRVFDSYLQSLETEISDKYDGKSPPPELKAGRDEFRALAQRLAGYESEFYLSRVEEYFGVTEKRAEPLVAATNELFKSPFSTAAFQTALFNTLFHVLEMANKGPRGGVVRGDSADDAVASEYLASLNKWFSPRDDAGARRVLGTLVGASKGSAAQGTLRVSKSAATLRNIVIGGELKPDEWPRFRYLLLEIWRSEDPEREELLNLHRMKCREEAARAYFGRRIREYCEEEGIDLADIAASSRHSKKVEGLLGDSVETFHAALHVADAKLDAGSTDELRQWMHRGSVLAGSENE